MRYFIEELRGGDKMIVIGLLCFFTFCVGVGIGAAGNGPAENNLATRLKKEALVNQEIMKKVNFDKIMDIIKEKTSKGETNATFYKIVLFPEEKLEDMGFTVDLDGRPCKLYCLDKVSWD